MAAPNPQSTNQTSSIRTDQTGAPNPQSTNQTSSIRTDQTAGTVNTQSTSQKIKEAGREAGSILAGIHGVGEKIRGEFNEGVDGVFHEREGVAKNRKVADDGEYQINEGKFSGGTKNREGAVPGDGGRRTTGGL